MSLIIKPIIILIDNADSNYNNYPFSISMIRDYDYLFKVVIVGNSSVGKSSLLRRFVDEEFNESYLATIGVDFRFKTLNVADNLVKLQIWDTAGQCRFRTITSAYYKGAQAIFLVYDLTNETSFLDIQNFWRKQIEKYADPDIRIVLLGNKKDVTTSQRIDKQRIEKYAQQLNLKNYQVSAKNGEGIEEAMTDMIKELMKIHPKGNHFQAKNKEIEDLKKHRATIMLRPGTETNDGQVPAKKGCC